MKDIVLKSEELHGYYSELNKVKNKFFNRLTGHFDGMKINKTLRNYETLDFNKFNKQLAKQKFKLSLKKEEEWEDYFTYSKEQCLNITSKIQRLEDDINLLIYKSYDLTSEEIDIIENSFKE